MNNPQKLFPASSPLADLMARCKHIDDVRSYLLVDGARLLKHQVRGVSLLDVSLGTSLAVFDDTDHQAHAVGPLLFDLDWSAWSQPGQIRTLEKLFANDVCSFILSPLSRQKLAHHLHYNLDVVLADGEVMIMRFFDPRVLECWYQILPANHRYDLGLGVTEWGYFNHQQQLCWLQLEKNRPVNNEAAYPLEITAEQEDALMQHCLPYALLDQLLSDAGSGMYEVEKQKRYELLAALMEKSQRYGFDGMGNLENFCRLGLKYGIDFDLRAPMKRALEDEKKPTHLHEFLAQISDKDWEAMQA